MPRKPRPATSILEQLTADSEGLAGLATSPFGVLSELVRRNAETVLDPDHCDHLVSVLINTGKATISAKDATKLLSVADLAGLVVHPYFVRAAARRGLAHTQDHAVRHGV